MAHRPRTFTNSNHAARDFQATQAPRWRFRTFNNSGWHFQDGPRDQSWTQAPSTRSFQYGSGPRGYPNSERPRGGNRYAQTPQRSQRVITANDQFGLIISLVFEICQLRHHATNWIELPKSIGKNVDTLFHNITLPRPNDDLTNRKIALKNLLKYDLQEIAQEHIKSQLDRAQNKIKLIDPTDKNECKHIVRNKLIREIPRINRESLDSWIDESLSMVGTQYTDKSYSEALQQNIERKQDKTVNARQTCNTSNSQRNKLDSLDDITLVKQPYTAVKRRLPASPPIQVSNRFEVLRDLEPKNPMKVRKLTVDDAKHVSQLPRKIHVPQASRKFSGASVERQAATDTDVAAAGGADSFVEVAGTDLTAAADADMTQTMGVTVVTAEATAAAAAGLCAVAAAAVAEATGVTGTTTVATTAEAPAAAAAGTTRTTGVTATVTTGMTEGDARAANATAAVTGKTASTGIGSSAVAADYRWPASHGDRRSSGPFSFTRTQSQPTLFQFGKSSSTVRTGTSTTGTGNKFVHDGWVKNAHILRVRSKAANVIIADSNFKLWQPDSENFEAHVFPGAKFNHTYRLLQTATIPDSVVNLIICVGVNHRTWDFLTSTLPELRKLIAATETMKQNVYFLGVSTPNLDQIESDNITRINSYAREKFGAKFFIPPLPRDQVVIIPGDPMKIHHDEDTMKRVFSSIMNQISAVSLN